MTLQTICLFITIEICAAEGARNLNLTEQILKFEQLHVEQNLFSVNCAIVSAAILMSCS